jgi:hypothetical protein
MWLPVRNAAHGNARARTWGCIFQTRGHLRPEATGVEAYLWGGSTKGITKESKENSGDALRGTSPQDQRGTRPHKRAQAHLCLLAARRYQAGATAGELLGKVVHSPNPHSLHNNAHESKSHTTERQEYTYQLEEAGPNVLVTQVACLTCGLHTYAGFGRHNTLQ